MNLFSWGGIHVSSRIKLVSAGLFVPTFVGIRGGERERPVATGAIPLGED